MIIFVLFILSIAIFAYICAPLYSANPLPDDVVDPMQEEISIYRDEYRKVNAKLGADEGHTATLEKQKSILEKRLVQSAKQKVFISSGLKTSWMIAIFLSLTIGSYGIYSRIGSPELINTKNLKPPVLSAEQALSQKEAQTVQHENNASIAELVAGLEKKLQTNDQDPQLWGLYARTLMTLGRYEEAFVAYEKTLSLTDNNPNLAAELKSARAFAAQQNAPSTSSIKPSQSAPPRGPNAQDVQAAAQMSPEDRSAMIQGMVDGLASRLSASPNDPEGWIRLLRARKVLGQVEIAKEEIETVKTYFESNQATVSDILQKSGWDK